MAVHTLNEFAPEMSLVLWGHGLERLCRLELQPSPESSRRKAQVGYWHTSADQRSDNE